MKKADYKVNKVNIIKGNEVSRSFPYYAGQKLHFTLSDNLVVNRKEEINNAIREWTDVVADDGVHISVSQLVRCGNGLNIVGKTNKERFTSFVNLFSNEGTLTLIIADIVTREFENVTEDGTTTKSRSNYLRFA